MKHFIFFILLSIPLIAYSQKSYKNDSIVISYNDMANFKTYYSRVDLTLWITLKDSGTINENNLKNGLWIEYSIDTAIMDYKTNIRNDSLKSEIYNPDIIKQTGLYIDGKRNGRWSFYFYDKVLNNSWILDKVIDYKYGLKNGFEIKFLSWGTDTSMIVEYVDDEPIEMKTYYSNCHIKSIVKQVGENAIRFNYDENGIKTDEEILK